MHDLLAKLQTDYPQITFAASDSFYWSPEHQTVYYAASGKRTASDLWSLLHEVSHGILGHDTYQSDFELVQLEVSAWAHARVMSKKYGVKIDGDHVEDCLDTYRDWLHRRSTCPTCSTVSIQQDPNTYQCFNCREQWHVSNSRFCRPYRRRVALDSANK